MVVGFHPPYIWLVILGGNQRGYTRVEHGNCHVYLAGTVFMKRRQSEVTLIEPTPLI